MKGHKEEVMKSLKSQPEEAREKVEGVSVDMWKYVERIYGSNKKIVPNAKIMYGRSHVMKMFNEELNKLRKK